MDKRTNRPEEFKHSSVKKALDLDQPVAKTAKELGIAANTLYGWINKYRHLFEDLSPKTQMSQSPPPVTPSEIILLRKENEYLKMENNILKKALACIANNILDTST